MATQQHHIDPYQSQSRKSGTMLAVGLVMLALMGGFALGRGGLFGRSGDVAGGGGQVVNLDVPGKAQGLPIQSAAGDLQVPTQLGYDPVSPDLSQGYQPEPNQARRSATRCLQRSGRGCSTWNGQRASGSE